MFCGTSTPIPFKNSDVHVLRVLRRPYSRHHRYNQLYRLSPGSSRRYRHELELSNFARMEQRRARFLVPPGLSSSPVPLCD